MVKYYKTKIASRFQLCYARFDLKAAMGYKFTNFYYSPPNVNQVFNMFCINKHLALVLMQEMHIALI